MKKSSVIKLLLTFKLKISSSIWNNGITWGQIGNRRHCALLIVIRLVGFFVPMSSISCSTKERNVSSTHTFKDKSLQLILSRCLHEWIQKMRAIGEFLNFRYFLMSMKFSNLISSYFILSWTFSTLGHSILILGLCLSIEENSSYLKKYKFSSLCFLPKLLLHQKVRST